MESSASTKALEDRVAKLQRAVYHLIWKRTGSSIVNPSRYPCVTETK